MPLYVNISGDIVMDVKGEERLHAHKQETRRKTCLLKAIWKLLKQYRIVSCVVMKG
jgi:hypothetical protein